MRAGLKLVFISALCALFLLTRVYNIFGTRFLVLYGSNIFDAKGIELNGLIFYLLWGGTISLFFWGLYLILTDIQSGNRNKYESILNSDNNKKCPMCAETIKADAKICKHCHYEFSEEELAKQKAEILNKEEKARQLKDKAQQIRDEASKLPWDTTEARELRSLAERLETEAKIKENKYVPKEKEPAALYCTQCGTKIESSSKFCIECGSKI